MEGEVTTSTPSAADLDAVAAEQKTAQDTTSASDTGDQISKAVEPTADNPAAIPSSGPGSIADPAGFPNVDAQRKQTIEEKFWPAQPPVESKAPPADTTKAPELSERFAKLEADFAALVKLLDDEYGIRHQPKEVTEARAEAVVEAQDKQ